MQEARLSVAMGDLQKAQAQLDEKEAELAKVREMYDQAMREKQARLYISWTEYNLSWVYLYKPSEIAAEL